MFRETYLIFFIPRRGPLRRRAGDDPPDGGAGGAGGGGDDDEAEPLVLHPRDGHVVRVGGGRVTTARGRRRGVAVVVCGNLNGYVVNLFFAVFRYLVGIFSSAL